MHVCMYEYTFVSAPHYTHLSIRGSNCCYVSSMTFSDAV
jgi:hypothetical protein